MTTDSFLTISSLFLCLIRRIFFTQPVGSCLHKSFSKLFYSELLKCIIPPGLK